MDDKRVLVAIRARPKLENAINALQSNERYQMEAAAKTSDSTIRLSDGKVGRDGKTHNFSYDLVFDKDSTQLDVYEETTLDAVDAVLMGCNATVMTYGQTGSGKTYTVLGSVKKNPLTNDIITGDTGLFLRALKDILTFAEQRAKDIHLVVGLSVIEIYLDEVRDLLSPEPTPPTVNVSIIRDMLSMPNLTYKPIQDLNDAVQAYKLANARRVSRATAANDTSSRSHAVFSIEVFQQVRTAANPYPMAAKELCELREKQQLAANTSSSGAVATPVIDSSSVLSARQASFAGAAAANSVVSPVASNSAQSPASSLTPLTASAADAPGSSFRVSNPQLVVPGKPSIMFSKLVLTDLAGSEKLKNSKVRGDGLEELKKINASLTALGNVVHSLYEGAKYIPYRDSKLTVMMRESFAAPNSKIVLIANVSPTVLTFDETLSTLFFADKVKGMKVDNPQGADVARLEVEFLNTMKTLEELAADLRVAGATHDYIVGGVRLRAKPETIHLPLAVLKRSPAQSLNARERELKALYGESSLAASRAAQEGRKEELQKMLDDLHAAESGTLVGGYKQVRQRVETMLTEAATSRRNDETEVREVMAEIQQQVVEAQEALAQLESDHIRLEPKKTSLPPTLAEMSSLIVVLDEQIVEMERKVFEANREHDESWTDAQRTHALQQTQWASSSKFADGCLSVWSLRSAYARARSDNIALMLQTSNTKHESETADVTHWIRSAVVRIARNAVATAISRARRAPSTRPAARSVAGSKAGSTSDLNSTRRSDPEGDLTPSNGDEATEVKRATTKRRGTLYDQPTLIKEILAYVQYGCTILKYGRSGAPHYRTFYIITNDEEGSRLCWDEEDDGRRLGKGSSITLASVTAVLLGRSTPVFARIPGMEGYYNSFSLEYVSKQQTRTLDLVCDTDAELESWVIAICYLTKKNPIFAKPLTLQTYNATSQLDMNEVQMCSEWHIPPDVFMSCKRRVLEAKQRTKNLAVKMSPGDVRMLTQLDIFRSSAVWRHFESTGLVENPFDRLYSYLEFEY
ncbi:kinesin, putative [Bodo saltans]|uniref:Kinesin, putative n=1 Tax=Bodo saltans TaxID=75058 RepID=A0A0S4IXS6_BODSA|nr:kinesin, putative [Bodo saltans]|eukprot:CUG10212.1 kinesin, putative [Bodo saltans]